MRRGRKPNYEKKTESYVFIGFGNGISRGWERKSTTGRHATSRFGSVPKKISSVGKGKVYNWELCILKITPIVAFVMTQRIFSSWTLAPTHFTILIRGLSILFFHSLVKSTFLVSNGLSSTKMVYLRQTTLNLRRFLSPTSFDRFWTVLRQATPNQLIS